MPLRRLITVALLATVLLAFPNAVLAAKAVRPNPGAPGQWRLIGQVQAKHTVDHDTILVQGPFDNFRRIKFKVTDSPLRIYRMVVTYDNGAPDRIEVRQNIPRAERAGPSTFAGWASAAFARSSSGTRPRAS